MAKPIQKAKPEGKMSKAERRNQREQLLNQQEADRVVQSDPLNASRMVNDNTKDQIRDFLKQHAEPRVIVIAPFNAAADISLISYPTPLWFHLIRAVDSGLAAYSRPEAWALPTGKTELTQRIS
jgi:hypothetical protein